MKEITPKPPTGSRVEDPNKAHEMAEVMDPFYGRRLGGLMPASKGSIAKGEQSAERLVKEHGYEVSESDLPGQVRERFSKMLAEDDRLADYKLSRFRKTEDATYINPHTGVIEEGSMLYTSTVKRSPEGDNPGIWFEVWENKDGIIFQSRVRDSGFETARSDPLR